MKDDIDELIEIGNQITFQKNSYRRSHGTYGKATNDFHAWAVRVEHFILEHYGDDSPPYRLFKKFNISSIEGNLEDNFERQHNILIGSLKACKNIKPQKKIVRNNVNGTVNHPIMSLITNNYFYIVIVFVGSSMLSLGLYLGNLKFDKDMNGLYRQVEQLKIDTAAQKQSIHSKDSLIDDQKLAIDQTKDSLEKLLLQRK